MINCNNPYMYTYIAQSDLYVIRVSDLGNKAKLRK